MHRIRLDHIARDDAIAFPTIPESPRPLVQVCDRRAVHQRADRGDGLPAARAGRRPRHPRRALRAAGVRLALRDRARRGRATPAAGQEKTQRWKPADMWRAATRGCATRSRPRRPPTGGRRPALRLSPRREGGRPLGRPRQGQRPPLRRGHHHRHHVVHQGRDRGGRAPARRARPDRLRGAGRRLLAGVRRRREGRRARLAPDEPLGRPAGRRSRERRHRRRHALPRAPRRRRWRRWRRCGRRAPPATTTRSPTARC